VKEYAAGKIEFRNDAGGNVHSVVGKLSFDKAKLVDNINAMVAPGPQDEAAHEQGPLHQEVVLKSTMSPAVHLQIA
jgi:large subunit ribosomal protein L1